LKKVSEYSLSQTWWWRLRTNPRKSPQYEPEPMLARTSFVPS